MQLAINPRDLSKFASASMDKSIKIWNITAESKANFTLVGHNGGVNCVDFYKGDKPYIVSGSDDRTVKIWDYQTKQCIVTIEGHLQSVSAVQFHPELPIILSCS
jgi:coatomer subunit beta'